MDHARARERIEAVARTGCCSRLRDRQRGRIGRARQARCQRHRLSFRVNIAARTRPRAARRADLPFGQRVAGPPLPSRMSQLFVLTERPSVYLASKSPRRQELLRQIGVEFEELLLREAAGRRRDMVESPRKEEAPLDYVKRVARTKASVAWHQMSHRGLPPRPILAADTEVILDKQVLGKPKDAAHAAVMLEPLSDRTHDVHTAVA